MLIAPIFHNSYLTTKKPDLEDNISSSTSTNRPDSDSISNNGSRYSIFKSALNRGTELIRNTFLLKTAAPNYTDSNSSPSTSASTSATTSTATTTTNISTTAVKQTLLDAEFKDESCSSSDSGSDRSSPDSIRTELMYFKPIIREAQTLSSAKVIRIPSIRSTSSNSTIQSPCPSPFSIPMTHQRQSAFSFVSFPVTTANFDDKSTARKPKSVKRTNAKSRLDEDLLLAPKKQKLNISKKKSATGPEKTTVNKRKKADQDEESKTDERARETRSKKRVKKQDEMAESMQNEFKAPSKEAAKARPKRKTAPAAAVAKVAAAAAPHPTSTVGETEFRRITRSMKN